MHAAREHDGPWGRDRAHDEALTRLARLVLTDYRNYARLEFRPGPGLNVVTGPNGSGKTNILEAVSLLGSGRGLRNARPDALARRHAGGVAWAIAATVEAAGAPHDIGTGVVDPGGAYDRDGRNGCAADDAASARSDAGGPGSGPHHRRDDAEAGIERPAPRRGFRLDGVPVRSQATLGALIPTVWLTPQMERLFGEQPAGRRRFLDRLVVALDPGHARTLAAHDASVQARNRLLLERRSERAWLDAAEDSIARHAVAAAASRLATCRRLGAEASRRTDPFFPAAMISLLDPIADRLGTEPARLVEDWLRVALAAARTDDGRDGVTRLGAHRADIVMRDAASGREAALASTGEQKALLVGIVLAHAGLVAADRGEAPVLLLDEPLVHLDADRRDALFRALLALDQQILLTGTDDAPFAPLDAVARFFVTGGDTLRPVDAPARPDRSRPGAAPSGSVQSSSVQSGRSRSDTI